MLAVAEKFRIEWYAQRDMHCMVSSACIACIARIALIACIGCTQSCMHACEACMHVYIACRHTVDGGNVASMTLLVCGRLQEKIIMLRLLGPPPPLLYNIDVRTSRCNIFSFRLCRLLVVSRRQYYRGGGGGDTNSLKSNSFRLNKIDATIQNAVCISFQQDKQFYITVVSNLGQNAHKYRSRLHFQMTFRIRCQRKNPMDRCSYYKGLRN